ncbi:Homocysteine-responsive endoplasmic reticulum-resident ubiquitin-like domain member 1 protein [Amazona aestiva]|uniref:Homocysteine-responsive endoplasmic reticulum-resident ubiquitin-like domain member 1 protein n=1 Tax=Amazona aestiva TaxID=12930 RepID=A0A0Q3X820_AMAAE|nr:Homocysteine-responsive endoplasmic reticulum-resident ubiquitin-like domain member 1 protein [Amazona aestiva]
MCKNPVQRLKLISQSYHQKLVKNQQYLPQIVKDRDALPVASLQQKSVIAYNMLQMSWFQQIYARQYYLQYLASTAASADPSHAHSSQEISAAPMTAPAPLPDTFPAQNQPGNQNAAAEVNAVANHNLRMNAQGGPLMEEEEEGGHRDWLDWLYSATLFYVFVNMIYFYSSVSRFLLVMGGSILMYLVSTGKLLQGAQSMVTKQALCTSASMLDTHLDVLLLILKCEMMGENAGGADESEASPDDGQGLQELQQTSPSLMGTVWVFFKTFFASLLPEGLGVTHN